VTSTSCGAGKLEQVSERLTPPARRPTRSEDLLPSERQFATAMAQLDFGRFESIRVRSGELILEPWPVAVRHLKFGAEKPNPKERIGEFELQKTIVEFFEFIRMIPEGEIRFLEIRHGLPFSMEIAQSTRIAGP
jgi:hypothetical protein